MRFPEQSTEQNQQVEAKLEYWHQQPLILASSSEYRKNELQKIGFINVSVAVVPDEIERAEQRRLEARPHGGFFDTYGMKSPEMIARKKVEYLLENTKVPDEAWVCGVDTMPMIFRYREKLPNEATTTIWKPEQLHKPDSDERVRPVIIETFRAAIEGWIGANDNLKKMSPANEEQRAMLVRGIKMGYLPLRIQVSTGVAVRFPNTNDIETFSASVVMLPRSLWKIARKYDEELQLSDRQINSSELPTGLTQELEVLADEVIAIMHQSGVDPTKVAGGVNWADERVRELLEVEEISTQTMEPGAVENGLYLGFPAQAFEDFLRSKAAEELTK